jgi:hypothetical protein
LPLLTVGLLISLCFTLSIPSCRSYGVFNRGRAGSHGILAGSVYPCF